MKPRILRKDVPKGENLCEYCSAKCCRYFALPIDTPDCKKDYDFIRWYLVHQGASIFTEDETWYLLVHADCRNLQEDHRCGIYHTRPQICQDYSTDNCEYDEHFTYERYFEHADQLTEYLEAVDGFTRKDSIRSPKPTSLPMVN